MDLQLPAGEGDRHPDQALRHNGKHNEVSSHISILRAIGGFFDTIGGGGGGGSGPTNTPTPLQARVSKTSQRLVPCLAAALA